jgi:hypothetical protein
MEAQSRLGSVNRRKLIIKRASGSCRFEFASGSPKSRFVSIALRDLARRGFGTRVIRNGSFTEGFRMPALCRRTGPDGAGVRAN